MGKDMRKVILVTDNGIMKGVEITTKQLHFLYQLIDDEIIVDIAAYVIYEKETRILNDSLVHFDIVDWDYTCAKSKEDKFYCFIKLEDGQEYQFILSANNLGLLEFLDNENIIFFDTLNYINCEKIEEWL